MRGRALVAGAVLLAAAGATPGALAGARAERRAVAYHGVVVRVPAEWPVVDLSEQPTRCARFDVHVVYLGRQGAEATCPALIVGAAEAVHLEPWDGNTELHGADRRAINGEAALVDETGRAGGRIVAALERARTIVRVTFGDDAALADEIVGSIRATEASSSGPSPGAGPTTAPPTGPAGAAALPGPGFAVAQTQPAPLQPGIFAGDAFDTCANPAIEKMEAWLASPYRAIGIYVGGVNHGCKAQTLSAEWVASAARVGWSFLPLYVGRQAPCYPGSTTAKIDPATAATQGREAANDAIAQADKFDLPTGSPLYFDMEAYSGDTSCKNAVHTFLQAWTTRLRERGYISGVYSSEASGVANLAAAYDDPGFVSPDVIWTAHWGESKRIFGHNQTWLPDSLWTNHQRLHQYEGGHLETWGGESINIDNDFVDAPAVRFEAVPRWTGGNIDGVGGTDLVHLCCGDYANTWLSQGDGTFTVKSHRPWPGYGLQLGTWLASDVSGDGKGDLVHLCCGDYVHVWLSNGDGSYAVRFFRPWSGYGLQLGRWLASDVNGDGKGDLVHLCCGDYAHVWLSKGDGSFSVGFFRPWSGYGLQLGRWLSSDANGDGKSDLVHLCCSDFAYTLLSNGNGTFTVRSYRPWSGYGLQLGQWLSSDANGDGMSDLIHLCCGDFAYSWKSNGDGSYVVRRHLPWAGYNLQAGSWMEGDADGDGDGDLFHLCCPAFNYTWFSQPDGTYDLIRSPV